MPTTTNIVMCKICRIEKATEFHGPTGIKLKSEGYCRRCLEKAIHVDLRCNRPVQTEENIILKF